MKPSLRKHSDHFVLRIGTYDLNSDRSLELFTRSITDVGSSQQNDSHDVSIWSIVVSNDYFKEKAAQVNENLEKLCAEWNVYFISHTKNLLPQHLNKSKLYLNSKVSQLMPQQIVVF